MLSDRQTLVARVIGFGLGAMLAALAGRLLYIYVTSAEPLAKMAVAQHYMRMPIRPSRGSILDARLRILAGSVEVESVFADPGVIHDPGEAAVQVAPLLDMPRDEVYRKLTARSESRFVWLKRHVSPEEAKSIRKLRFYGVGLIAEGQRRYPNGPLAAHVVGPVGREQQGLEGLEKLYDERLAGRDGEAYVLADRQRRPIWSEPDQFVPAEDGQHLILTIDAAIQAFAEEGLAEACETFQAKSGCAIVMDPHTGAILAMANSPTFDPARYGEFSAESRRNRAVTDAYPPGSTIKPFIAAMALERGFVHLGETIYCEDGYWAEQRLHDAGHNYGDLTFEMIVIKSSNVGMAKIGVRMGNGALYDALARFGFGRETGVFLPGETGGTVYPVGRWTKYSTSRVAFGQEFTATPLQLVTAFSSFANGGKMLRPKILRGVMDSRGRVVLDLSEPEAVGVAMTADTARTMVRQFLEPVIQIGTGKQCRIPGYRVFGKTGTGQLVDPETGEMSHTRYVSSFLAAAPADDARAVVLVLVNEPDRSLGYFGGTVAAPAARRILEQTLEYLGVPRTEDKRPQPVPTFLVKQELGP